MIAPWLVVALQVAAAPTCVSRFDRTVCGYHCTTSLADIACSKTPEGLCATLGGKVTCWDPPPDIRQLMAYNQDIPRPTCVSRSGEYACGFNCARSLTKAACANTPFGACESSFDRLVCFDPAPEVRWRMEQSNQLSYASCVSSLNQTSCGYHCETAGQKVRCATSPEGFCQRHFDQIACFDPASDYQAPISYDPR